MKKIRQWLSDRRERSRREKWFRTGENGEVELSSGYSEMSEERSIADEQTALLRAILNVLTELKSRL